MSVSDARDALASLISPITRQARVELSQALGRVCAEDVVAPHPVPPHANSAMDGYAIHSDDLPCKSEVLTLEVVGVARAGAPYASTLKPGEAVQIMTGAALPKGADTVVIDEHCQVKASRVTIGDDTAKGRNVRQAGEDLQCGEVVVAKGTRIGPAQMGLLASLGQREVNVYCLARVAIMSTGDELVALSGDQALGEGQIYDSNRYSLLGLLQGLPVDVEDLGVIGDDLAQTRSALAKASASADVVLSTGGASASDADFVSKALAELGEMGFWKIAMRPGRPLGVGRIGDALCFALPGNPVAVMVSFYEFVQPTLLAMLGASPGLPQRFLARAATAIRKIEGRVEIQRGLLHDDGQCVMVEVAGNQGAGRLSSVASANCLIELEAERGRVEAGESVWVRPMHGLNGLY